VIDPRAAVDVAAELDEGVSVGPFAVIGPGVRVGRGTTIGPHAVIQGPTIIGEDNRIFQFASVGEAPQDKKYGGEDTRLEIGDRNVIRECATVHRGTVQDEGVTRIGNDGLFMAYTHVAHDCRIGDHVIMANGATLAGHVVIEDHVILGGFTLVHQFCSIGAHSFTAMGTAIGKDVPPYLMVGGNPAKPHGINTEGLKRRGFTAEQLKVLKAAYRVLYLSGLKLEEARLRLDEMSADAPEAGRLAEFLVRSRRSIVR
jgi:UDP-N-acetylglucosamine acyltransferase